VLSEVGAARNRPSSLCGAARRRISFREGAQGIGGWSVLEIVAFGEAATFRAVYTLRFADAVYVPHAFQKKSKKGITTPKQEIDLIRHRLAAAERDYRGRQN
jgi:phage-related protein